MLRYIWILFIGAAVLVGCGAEDTPSEADDIDSDPETEEADGPQAEFWANLEALCGQAFAGEAIEAPEGDDTFHDEELVMHVRQCFDDEIRIPFHVSDNHSRTWIITDTEEGLRLKHDHRNDDGSEEEITLYGGDTADRGTSTSQAFAADEYTADLVPAAASNVWTIELTDDSYTYILVREETGARYEVRFDLTEPVDPPQAPWGYEDTDPTHGDA